MKAIQIFKIPGSSEQARDSIGDILCVGLIEKEIMQKIPWGITDLVRDRAWAASKTHFGVIMH